MAKQIILEVSLESAVSRVKGLGGLQGGAKTADGSLSYRVSAIIFLLSHVVRQTVLNFSSLIVVLRKVLRMVKDPIDTLLSL